MYIQKAHRYSFAIKCSLAIACFGLILVAFSQITHAEAVSWVVGEPSVVRTEQRMAQFSHRCELRLKVKMGDTTLPHLCEYTGKDVRFYEGIGYEVISIGKDTQPYLLISGYISTLLPGTNTAVRNGAEFSIEKDITDGSLRKTIYRGEIAYSYQHTPDFTLMNGETPWKVKDYGYSKNSKWMALHVEGLGLVRLNMETFEVKRFAQVSHDHVRLHISNDGSVITMSGQESVPFTVFELTGGCGDVIGSGPMDGSLPMQNACPERSLANMPQATDYGTYVVEVSDDNGLISYISAPNPDGSLGHPDDLDTWTTIKAAGYVETSRLDYLAMGDSISSGEGDTEIDPRTDKKYYRGWTDIDANPAEGQPREDCHLSTRSYPYDIARFMNLAMDSPQQWNSVACSGANSSDIGGGSGPRYMGQNNRLEGFYNRSELMAQALNEFIPGRNEQIEFVKKYRPKVITLTAGANNIGFADKLKSCVLYFNTCYTAQVEGRKSLAKEIKNQYTALTDLYKNLYKASGGQAKIYAVGYPQLVNDDATASCESNVLNLNAEERETITQATSYMNDVIRSAAEAAGVKYVDIEDIFMPNFGQDTQGHRLCDSGTKYVTGAALWMSSEQQESFHPNHLGQARIAAGIKQALSNESLLDYDACPGVANKACPKASISAPPIPAFFGAETDANVHSTKLTTERVIKSVITNITVPKFTFAPNSNVSRTLYSDPVDLGEATANADGRLEGGILVPDTVRPGFHTLVFTGKSYSGEPLELTQVIEVIGTNQDDRDEDGVSDGVDECLYVSAANKDVDADEIDDACDPLIEASSIPYRVRNGRTASGEHPNYLFIERNIYAGSVTGVTDDDDPDGDGWAIVGASRNNSDSGRAANFWVDSNHIPHVSTRTPENGCVQYKPADLSRVTSGVARTLVREATDTNTCRTEPQSADMDKDSVPDDIQPLYRARNGDPARGENPLKIYLERSTRAAETQLGKSDYAPNSPDFSEEDELKDYRQSWSLVASSQGLTTAGTVKRLEIISKKPYILTTSLIGVCVVLKPTSLNTIKQSTQHAKALRVDLGRTMLVNLKRGCK